LTCKGWYCNKCNTKHKIRTDKYKVVHNDKCKKELTNKLLQGDTIEHPSYIEEKKLKIDYNYYLSHQIEKPVYQIFELVMKKPESIIADLVRKMNNAKSGNQSIKNWLQVMAKKSVNLENTAFSVKEKVPIISTDDDTEDANMLGDNFEEDKIEDLDNLTFEEKIDF